MPRVRNILGHVSVEVAARKRRCHRSGGTHGILVGDACLVVKDGLNRKNYCRECSAEILTLAGIRLAHLSAAVDH